MITIRCFCKGPLRPALPAHCRNSPSPRCPGRTDSKPIRPPLLSSAQKVIPQNTAVILAARKVPVNLSSELFLTLSCADLRMKLEPSVQEEPLSSTAGTNSSSANGSLGPMSNYDPERDKADLMSSTLWNSVTGKLTKSGSVTTPDGRLFICLLIFLFRSLVSVTFPKVLIELLRRCLICARNFQRITKIQNGDVATAVGFF